MNRPLFTFLLGVLIGVLLCVLGTPRRHPAPSKSVAECALDYAEHAATSSADAIAAYERLCAAAGQ